MGYSYSFNEENFYGDFDTRKKAINEAIDYNPDALSVYTGKTIIVNKPLVGGKRAIGSIIKQAFDAYGCLNHASRADRQKLDEMLTKTFDKWAKETGKAIGVLKAINVKKYIVPHRAGRDTK